MRSHGAARLLERERHLGRISHRNWPAHPRSSLLPSSCAAAAFPVIARQETLPVTRRTFDPERFKEDCRAAVAAGGAIQAQVEELLKREMADPAAVLAGLGAPTKGALTALYRSPELTILNIVWSPLMQLLPHDHNLWALIGIYTGREDNIFWRRGPEKLQAVGATAISIGDVVSLPVDVIHS